MRALAVVILVAGFILGGWAAARAEADAPAERPAKVTGDRVNLRGTPSTSGEKVGTLAQGDAVTILEEQGEWYRLRLETGQTGWAARKYIEVLAETPAETSQTPASESSHAAAKEAVTPRAEKQRGGGGGGGSVIGSVLKWGCLVGAGAFGYLAYSEHTNGDSSYKDYQKRYESLIPPQGNLTPEGALQEAEHFRVEAKDHDKKSQTYAIVAGGLGAAFLVQQLFLGKHGDQAALETDGRQDGTLLACGLQQGQVRAAVTLARF